MNLKQLSEALGLSPTTVSRALNGYPEVNEDTRERVRLAAQKHNYKPHARAQSLATGRAFAIGHVIPISTHQHVVNPIFGDFIAGAGETYSANGYEMVLSMVSDSDELGAYKQIKARGSVDGVVVHGARRQDARFSLLRDINLPFVSHGRSSGETEPYAWVDVNNFGAFERATSFLLELGHRKIALLNGPETMDFAVRRREGFEAALLARAVAPVPSLLASQEMTETYGYREANRMLSSNDAPTAFVVSSFITALGVRRAIEQSGLQMGRDVSVVTYDDALSYLPNGDEVPVFTATRSSVSEAGRIAGQILIDMINDPFAPPKRHLLEAELMIGMSTGPCLTAPS